MSPRVVRTVPLPSIEGVPSVHDGVQGDNVFGFAAVESVDVREGRWELLREAKFSLGEWERHRRPEDRARLIASLETLAAIIRSEPS